jgi:signal peptidase II
MLLLAVLLTGFCADLLTKRWARDHLRGKDVVTVIEGFVELSYTENDGMVFGLFSRQRSGIKQGLLIFLTCVSILYIAWIVWRLRKLSFFILMPFFIILSGATANLTDRIVSIGVVDFIHIHWRQSLDWPYLFNIADAFITVGGFVLLLMILLKKDVFDKHLFHPARED